MSRLRVRYLSFFHRASQIIITAIK